jgi:hypothetical protein
MNPTATADLVATGVAVQRAVAATLTGEILAPTSAPIRLPSSTPDAVATGVAVQRAIAATLTAESPTTGAVSGPAVSSPTIPPETSTATTTSSPTVPPAPTSTPTPEPCLAWSEAGGYAGTVRCVCGIVDNTYDDPGSTAFFINFGAERTGYYAVSFTLTFEGLEGRCIRVCGAIEMYRGRPQTVIDNVDQIGEYPSCP